MDEFTRDAAAVDVDCRTDVNLGLAARSIESRKVSCPPRRARGRNGSSTDPEPHDT
jgi:hypothetical protein